jgi:hypothetical protein
MIDRLENKFSTTSNDDDRTHVKTNLTACMSSFITGTMAKTTTFTT